MSDFCDVAEPLPAASAPPAVLREPFLTTAMLVRVLGDSGVPFGDAQRDILRRVLLCPVRMLLLALGLLTRAEFPLDIAEDVGFERIFSIPLGLPATGGAGATADAGGASLTGSDAPAVVGGCAASGPDRSDAIAGASASGLDAAGDDPGVSGLQHPGWSVFAVLQHTSLWHCGWSPELQTALDRVESCLAEDSAGVFAFAAWLHWLAGNTARAAFLTGRARMLWPAQPVVRLVSALTAPPLQQIRAVRAAQHEALCNLTG